MPKVRVNSFAVPLDGYAAGSEPNRRTIHEEAPMFTPDVPPFRTLTRVPLATIDAIVSSRLGTTRVKGKAQPAVFDRQIAMFVAKTRWRLEHDSDWQVL